MNVKQIASVAAVAALGFVALKVAMKVKAGIDAGEKTVDAIKDSIVEVVTKDLNPLSQDNLAISAANSIASAVTQRETTFGGELYDAGQRAKTFFKDVWFRDPSAPSNVQTQAALMEVQKENFRRVELAAERAREAEVKPADATMTRRRSNFRISEIVEQNYGFGGKPPVTDFERFMLTLEGQPVTN